MTKLKPCPFCGGKAEIRMNVGDGTYQVCCTRCPCRLGSKHETWESGIGKVFFGIAESAIDAWNRRAGDDS